MREKISDLSPHARRLAEAALLLVITLAVLAWRRPDQLRHPYIWVEEGAITLPDYLKSGWLSVFDPVAGYLVLPAKIIFLTAATISIDQLPRIEYWLTVFFTFAVCAAIALSPSVLKHPYLCALLALLVPTDAEVFGVSEYTFWWGTLLAVVALLWNGRGHVVWRTALTLIGGFSSPAIVLFVPLFGVRWWWQKTREDGVVLAAAALSAAVQCALVIITSAGGRQPNITFEPEALVERFFGMYASTWQPFTIGCLLIGTIALYAIQRKRVPILILIGLLLATIAAALSRVPATVADPALAGQRYFFYPYMFISWLLLQVIADGKMGQKAICAGLIALGLYQFAERGQRRHVAISWPQEMAACRADDAIHPIPIHTFGDRERAWNIDLSGADCRALKDRSLF